MNPSYDKIWSQVLDAVMAAGVFEQNTFSWLKKTSLFRIDENEAYIAFRSIISYNLLNNNKELFADTLSELWGTALDLVFVNHKDMEQMMPEVVVQERTNTLLDCKFNENYTFESFVEGSSNAEAYAACLAVCTGNSGGMFNPLMLFGNSGLGKTHLLHAVGNYLRKEKPESRVLYMYSGDFVSLLIEAMKTKNVHGNTVERVKEQLLDCDYFLIDDIQNLSHASSQEIFFTVYNKLLQQDSQIILTSDIHPQELSGLQARLVSRFKSGLAINISKPGFETSKAILKKKLEGREEICQIEEDVIDFLALRFSNDVRNLEGSLNRLIFNATLFNPPVINMEFASSVLETEAIIESDSTDLNVKEIKKAVTRYYGLAYKDLEGKSRQKKIMTARHMCVWLCRELLHKPYAVIGVELGGRDHKTIASSYERACLLLKKEQEFLEAAEDLRNRLGEKRQ